MQYRFINRKSHCKKSRNTKYHFANVNVVDFVAGKSLKLSKMMVIKINRNYISKELGQCAHILDKLEPVTGRLPQSPYNLADILLDLMKDNHSKVWEILLCSLREVKNDTMADRLERMTCAGIDFE